MTRAASRSRRRRRWGWLVLAAVIAVAVAAVAWHGRHPWLVAFGERERAAELRRDVEAEQARTRELEEKQGLFQTPKRIEVEARRQGWVKPDEEIVNLPEAGTED